MSDVFISYARSNEALARRVAEQLRAAGFSVWWDEELPTHRNYYEVIEERLRSAKAVVAIWSKAACDSQWVRAEADLARSANKLVQVTADGTLPPIPFNQIHCAHLRGWRGAPDHPEWSKVLESVRALVARGEAAGPRETAGPQPGRQPRRVAMVLAGLAAAAAAAAVVGGWLLSRGPPSSADHDLSRVAVRPFEALAGGSSVQAFAATLTDDMTGVMAENEVATVPAAQARALAAQGRDAALRSGVAYMVGGAVTEQGGKLRVRASIEDVASGVVVWSAQFERPAAQADVLRDMVTVAAAESVYSAFSIRGQPDVTVDPQTVALIIEADHALRTQRPAERGVSLRAAELAAQRAPRLAGARGVHGLTLVNASREAGPAEAARLRARAREEVAAAIRLHPASAGAGYDALYGLTRIEAPRDFAAAEKVLDDALRNAPEFPFLSMRLCRHLMSVGRLAEAVTRCQRAYSLFPLAGPIAHSNARAFYAAGEPATAQQIIDKAIRYHPEHREVRRARLQFAMHQGPADAALAILGDPDQRPPDLTPEAVASLSAFVRAKANPTAASTDAAIAQMQAAAAVRRLDPRNVASAAAMLGRTDAAFAALESAPLELLLQDPTFLFEPWTAPLRRDARFWPLARRLGLLDYWRASKAWPDFCQDPAVGVDCAAASRAGG